MCVNNDDLTISPSAGDVSLRAATVQEPDTDDAYLTLLFRLSNIFGDEPLQTMDSPLASCSRLVLTKQEIARSVERSRLLNR